MEEESIDQNNQHVSRFLNFSDQNNPYMIEHGDNTVASLVADLLITENYVTWSRAMRRALRAKNKIGFINGDIKRPTSQDDPLMEAWERCNDVVVSWIHNSLKKSLASLSQGDDSVSIYFGKIKTIWDELALYGPMPECSCAQLKILMERYQRDCVIQFLMGLSDCYSNTRDQIMLIEPMPALNRVFSMIQQQEKQHQMISGTPSPDLMAMFTKGSFGNFKPTNRREMPYCTHWHKMHNKGKGSSAFVAQSNIQVEVDQGEGGDDKMALTKGQYQQLLALLQ
ncbi:uncharacterized protein LOC122310190 [Carya illinoinensis]|uniref:uncharacterized protein LOC122310190 n=1 Tax=Carya illinoinensis TaxID=32201 RepID=UPI001C727B08|nr:uncharacterized protein LOC122310190 [Carya illinoinensis]